MGLWRRFVFILPHEVTVTLEPLSAKTTVDARTVHQENWKILFCTFLYLFAFIIKKAKKKLHILFLLNFQLV
jgi:hypothetical protein